jgi:hypothetical protein
MGKTVAESMKLRSDFNNDGLSTPDDSAARDIPTLQTTEAQMRRALGLGDSAGQRSEPQERPPLAARQGERHSPDRHKRRFVRDGEVPVVVVRRDQGGDLGGNRAASVGAPPTNRVEQAEAALRAERDARERAERALSEAQGVIRDLQTKLGHAGLARDEASDTARRADAEKHALEHALEMAESALQAERRARETAEAALEDALADREISEQRVREAVRSSPVKTTIRKTAAPKAPRAEKPAREPQPVKWWIQRTNTTKRR